MVIQTSIISKKVMNWATVGGPTLVKRRAPKQVPL